MKLLRVEQLKKHYGDVKAVDGISFEIASGEIFGFLGPNGAGKTSTIHMLTGLARPTSGSIWLDGIDGIRDIKRAQRMMGIVPDESNLYDEMDGFENLCFCGALYGMRKKEREQRAHELLEQFQLKAAENRVYKKYSKGMRRKLTIAAGIIHNPPVLFLDEPTTGIDVESARQIRSMITQMKHKGTTLFLTTHYIEEAQRICDRIAFILQGKIVKTDSVENLMKHADNRYRILLKMDDGVDLFLERYQKEIQRLGIEDIQVETTGKDSWLLSSPKPFPLAPVLQNLDEKGIRVYEARQIRPSLEDVFVKVTGMEAQMLKKEKEGGRK